MATISTLAPYVQNRLEESGPGAWWSLVLEIYSAIAEAQNDLMLLIGRPTQQVMLPFTLLQNSVWQIAPQGTWAISDIYCAGRRLRKISLYDLDYIQSSWGSDWEQDVDLAPKRWAPLGFDMFIVHPAVSGQVSVNLNAIQYPQTDIWPYTGNENIVFEDNYFQLLEEYAAAYCRLKETGLEFQEATKLLERYMQGARRMTEIQDRRDPLLFTMGYGAMQNVNPITKR